MDESTRQELNTLHGRLTEVSGRVTVLEAERPFIKESLGRIETSVDNLNGHLNKAIWLVLAAFLAVVVKFTVDGGWTAHTKTLSPPTTSRDFSQ